MRQPGVTIRPIRQMTGTAEFNEVHFEGARTARDWVVGQPGDGWRVAMGTLGYERSRRLAAFPSMLAELMPDIDAVGRQGKHADPIIRDRTAHSYTELHALRATNLRMLGSLADGRAPGPESSIGKLFWSHWHQRLCNLETDLGGLPGQLISDDDYTLSVRQHAFLYSRAESIFAGSSEIQRNIIGERVLGLPRE
jgi:alkylation response protein AidB-like acyl-CoA dehydrogenase